MKLTADTITDEQIRELCDVPEETRRLALDWLLYRAFWRSSSADDTSAAADWRAAKAARARCAEILNQRASKEAK